MRKLLDEGDLEAMKVFFEERKVPSLLGENRGKRASPKEVERFKKLLKERKEQLKKQEKGLISREEGKYICVRCRKEISMPKKEEESFEKSFSKKEGFVRVLLCEECVALLHKEELGLPQHDNVLQKRKGINHWRDMYE